MQTSIQARFIGICAVMLVLGSGLSAGCTSSAPVPQENRTTVNTDFGFRPMDTNSSQGSVIGFDEAASYLGGLVPDTGNLSAANSSPQNHVLYVRGSGVSADGDAVSWTFVTGVNNRTYVVAGGSAGTTVTEWKGQFPRSEMNLDSIIRPRELFRKNQALISGSDTTRVSRDLILSMNSYTLTISGQNQTRVLVFDARTGAPLRSNG